MLKMFFKDSLQSRILYHCPFQEKSLVDDVGEVGFRFDLHVSGDG